MRTMWRGARSSHPIVNFTAEHFHMPFRRTAAHFEDAFAREPLDTPSALARLAVSAVVIAHRVERYLRVGCAALGIAPDARTLRADILKAEVSALDSGEDVAGARIQGDVARLHAPNMRTMRRIRKAQQ